MVWAMSTHRPVSYTHLDVYKRQGRDQGRLLATRQAVVSVCTALGLGVDAERRTWLETLSLEALEALPGTLIATKRWPDE